ncbi:MAG: hypothetical protein H0V73_11015 [Chloroflexi bacterium]|nr:hypothetical protein [Chloroflexota bacterium]
MESLPTTIFVEVRPDPFERRQVARWFLSAFEVLVTTILVSSICWWIGAVLASAVSQAIGNDLAGTFISALVWSTVFGLVGAYVTLRLLAR